MAEYTGTENPDIVNKSTTYIDEINLQEYVDLYLDLEQRWTNRIKSKTEPDQETLDFYNAIAIEDVDDIILKASELYNDLLPIYEGGLLPSTYNDELLRLKNFLGK